MLLDTGDGFLQALDAHRAFFQRALHAGAQLFFVERLSAAVLLDQARHHQLGGFEGGEALTAGHAFAAAADLVALGDQTGVDDLGVVGSAERTMHGEG